MVHIAHLQGSLYKHVLVRRPLLSLPIVLTLCISTFPKFVMLTVGTATTTKTALSSVLHHLMDAAQRSFSSEGSVPARDVAAQDP